MIVRFDKDGLLQNQQDKDVGVDTGAASSAKVSEVDKIVMDTKQKITDGSTPAVGVSASNSGRGHDRLPLETDNENEDFVPTVLDGTVEEEPMPLGETDSPEVTPGVEKLASELKIPERTSGS